MAAHANRIQRYHAEIVRKQSQFQDETREMLLFIAGVAVGALGVLAFDLVIRIIAKL